MALQTQTLERSFRYNSIELPDPGPQYTIEQMRDLYSATYPEIVSAGVDGPEEREGKLVYTFRRAVGTKGADILLTLRALRQANLKRLPLFKNRRGEPAHSEPDGSDWPLDEWTNAFAGEVGESCNLAKKLVRGDFGPHGSPGYIAACSELAHELADIVIYADLASFRAGSELVIDIASLCADEERDPKAARIAGLTNRIAAKAGTACSIADDLRPGRSQYTGLQIEELQKLLGKWLAAAVLTAETACSAIGHDPNRAIVEKFNIVSDRVGCTVRL